jgi:hypothetical protein
MKVKPFLPPWGSKLFIGSIFLVIPYWIAETFFNFEYFNELGNDSFVLTRPWEAAMRFVCVPILALLVYASLNVNRDGWWIFATCRLIYVIKHAYNLHLSELIKESPRFGVLITSMLLSIAFVFIDIAVTVHPLSADDGVNPFWKVWKSFVAVFMTLTHQ